MNENSRKAIKESKTLQDIGRQFRREKMLYLQEQAMKKVINGTTAMNEVVRIFAASKKQKQEKTK
jgi:type II secretory ATPase GspE/PulE/Tfp pilus assembly ATPase PilB-like protein